VFFDRERKSFLQLSWYGGAVLAILKNSIPVDICKIINKLLHQVGISLQLQNKFLGYVFVTNCRIRFYFKLFLIYLPCCKKCNFFFQNHNDSVVGSAAFLTEALR